MVAAEQLGRVCYAMEKSPPFVGVILERMLEMGLKPALARRTRPAATARRNVAKRGAPVAATPGLAQTQKAPQGVPQGAEVNA
ncbi:MAG: hypothetical protein A3G20_00115 [Acidobacteria bacterium RIFCSPLOWO2_12_FULL_59_11]|nr:MAG: hypothetical protein A3G20_00115 [Acidobacteria bacterium RIFCSPLOWO2_12_FULL_59_11]